MTTFTGTGMGKIIVINLARGEKVLECIVEAVQKAGIRNGVVLGAIGSLQRAHLHRVTSLAREPVDEFVVLEKPMELASIQGIIADCHPHLHMVVSDLEKTYTGHLEPDTIVAYLVEITVAELGGVSLQRVKNEDNIAQLQQCKS
jgi:predicted DNA-binding protein with PD1-like motif